MKKILWVISVGGDAPYRGDLFWNALDYLKNKNKDNEGNDPLVLLVRGGGENDIPSIQWENPEFTENEAQNLAVKWGKNWQNQHLEFPQQQIFSIEECWKKSETYKDVINYINDSKKFQDSVFGQHFKKSIEKSVLAYFKRQVNKNKISIPEEMQKYKNVSILKKKPDTEEYTSEVDTIEILNENGNLIVYLNKQVFSIGKIADLKSILPEEGTSNDKKLVKEILLKCIYEQTKEKSIANLTKETVLFLSLLYEKKIDVLYYENLDSLEKALIYLDKALKKDEAVKIENKNHIVTFKSIPKKEVEKHIEQKNSHEEDKLENIEAEETFVEVNTKKTLHETIEYLNNNSNYLMKHFNDLSKKEQKKLINIKNILTKIDDNETKKRVVEPNRKSMYENGKKGIIRIPNYTLNKIDKCLQEYENIAFFSSMQNIDLPEDQQEIIHHLTKTFNTKEKHNSMDKLNLKKDPNAKTNIRKTF